MRIPAINAKIGDWNYYIATLTFKDLAKNVKRIGDELHKSKTLSDMIQRSITKNYLSIKQYLLQNDERFFNSVVLAVYDGDPNWIEVDFDYKETRYTSIGLLEFTGDEKIFPVDGQHRIEGIKSALKENKALGNEEIPVILISHRKTKEGMERTRRLFSTLNRYAKPVTPSEIIALDEDDVVAIITRSLVENHVLFEGNRISLDKTKAISDKNKTAFTSIETLYNCNLYLLKAFMKEHNLKYNREEMLRKRPSGDFIQLFNDYSELFWNEFTKNIDHVRQFLKENSNAAALPYRNSDDGGKLLFRPLGLQPFVNSIIEINKKNNLTYGVILQRMNKINFNLNELPWKQVLWNDYEKVMLPKADKLVTHLLMYMYDSKLLTEKNVRELIKGYAAKINMGATETEELLEEIKDISKK
ncbi:putative DGQHR domain protein [Paenibacillus mucilaginosus 3016]|uniref:Putative DGQHR domain protein n=1 Tax=Paenibacillus mucilaginosus 3016 TaxID=1116391 RepID=H6NNI1_9BACL|nr:DNA sulfur modification protein DndB [Paenibacillus mucilaginosus]AFC33302.1 putative DGQHR domain protein [Paenibacillus mucilaginosus 3016]WFA21719.1 DGQHR domain-containing protein [Paenibacillus mucilaginosus]